VHENAVVEIDLCGRCAVKQFSHGFPILVLGNRRVLRTTSSLRATTRTQKAVKPLERSAPHR
jgi:hypothetical protein